MFVISFDVTQIFAETVTWSSFGLADVYRLAQGAFYAVDSFGGSACETVGDFFHRLGPVTLSTSPHQTTSPHHQSNRCAERAVSTVQKTSKESTGDTDH